MTREELAALERLTKPETPKANPAPGGEILYLNKDKLQWRWTAPCPGCGRKLSGNATPRPGKRLARCGGCQRVVHLAKG